VSNFEVPFSTQNDIFHTRCGWGSFAILVSGRYNFSLPGLQHRTEITVVPKIFIRLDDLYLLEILQAAKSYGAIVEAITIWDVQKVALDDNIRAAGLSDRIKVHVIDYRNMPESFHHAFDAVVSIGVMEHGELY